MVRQPLVAELGVPYTLGDADGSLNSPPRHPGLRLYHCFAVPEIVCLVLMYSESIMPGSSPIEADSIPQQLSLSVWGQSRLEGGAWAPAWGQSRLARVIASDTHFVQASYFPQASQAR